MGKTPIIGALAIEQAIEVLMIVSKVVEIRADNDLLRSVRAFLLGHENEDLVPDIDRRISDD